MHFTLLFVVSALPHVLSVIIESLVNLDDIDKYTVDCSSKYINRVTSCVTTQQCGRGGITSPLDSCQMRWFARYPFIDIGTELGYNTVFRFKVDGMDTSLVGTFKDSYDADRKNTIMLDERYANNGVVFDSKKNADLEIHPHYFSDLKLRLSAVSGISSASTGPCPTADLDNTSDCGTPGNSQLYCPIYVRLVYGNMCDKCYKATFGVKGKPTAHYNYAGVVELHVKIKRDSYKTGMGYYYHVTNEVANRVVSEVCDSACVSKGEGYCPDSEESCGPTIDSTNAAFPTAIHNHMYLREIDCSTKLDVDDPICERKARRSGAHHYKSERVVFNAVNGRPSCDCVNTAFWNVDTQECVDICDSIPCAGQSETPGSCVAYYHPLNYACSCGTGHIWNKDTKGCVADASAPTPVCTLTCKQNEHCVYLAEDPTVQWCVCDGGHSQVEREGECVAFKEK